MVLGSVPVGPLGPGPPLRPLGPCWPLGPIAPGGPGSENRITPDKNETFPILSLRRLMR